MRNLLIYYGWLNSFNSAQNSWTNEKVAQDLAKYGVLVLGDGIQDSNHGDYSNTSVIIPRIKALNPNCLIFGYVTVNQIYANFSTKLEQWVTLGVHGIFMDEAGYDYGSTSTNGRSAFNDKVDLVHGHDMHCFVNAWNIEHVLGNNTDASYPDSTWNPDILDSNLEDLDWYLLESFAIKSDASFESRTQWASRGDKCKSVILDHPINLAACSVISDSDGSGQAKFDFIYRSAIMWDLAAVGSSDVGYGATNAKSKMWTRPDVSNLGSVQSNDPAVVNDNDDTDVYHRYFEGGRLNIDFSSSAETSSTDVY